MKDKFVGNVQVPVGADDQKVIEDILESSPFPRQVLLHLALKIGIESIKRDPTVLMPYVAKQDTEE